MVWIDGQALEGLRYCNRRCTAKNVAWPLLNAQQRNLRINFSHLCYWRLVLDWKANVVVMKVGSDSWESSEKKRMVHISWKVCLLRLIRLDIFVILKSLLSFSTTWSTDWADVNRRSLLKACSQARKKLVIIVLYVVKLSIRSKFLEWS